MFAMLVGNCGCQPVLEALVLAKWLERMETVRLLVQDRGEPPQQAAAFQRS